MLDSGGRRGPPWPCVALAILSGCAAVGTTFEATSAPDGPWRAAALLASALGEDSDEVFRILRPPAPPEPARPARDLRPATRERTGRMKIGVRGGLLTPGGADVDWSDATQYGLYLRRVSFKPRKVLPVACLGLSTL